MAFSFGTSGSLPSLGSLFGGGSSPLLGPSSPYGKALAGSSATPNMSTNYGPVVAPPPVTSPSTALKQSTIAHPDGTTVTQTYHAPVQPATEAQTVSANPSQSNPNANYQTPGIMATGPTYSGINGVGTGSIIPTGQPSTQYQPVQTPVQSPTQSTPVQAPAQTSTNTASSVPATYPGILASAVGASSNAATTGADAYNQAIQAANQYQNTLSGLMNQQGQENANINASPLQIDFKQGQEVGLQSLFGAQENAASQGLQSEQGIANTAANLQGQGISGLGTATGNASPGVANVTAPAGEVTTNTLTGQQYSNPTLGPIGSQQFYSPQPNGTPGQTATAGQATQYTVKAGDSLTAIAAQNGMTAAQLEAANPQITNPNLIQPGQQITIPAPQSGTPFTAGQVQGDQALGQQYAANVSAVKQATAIKGQIQSYIAANPNLNPSVFTDVNSLIQLMSGKVSNPQYQTLSNYLSEYVSTLAPILGVGGDTTNLKTQIAQGFVNAAQSGQSISTVLDGIEQLANAKLAAQVGGSNSTGAVANPSSQQPTYSNAAGNGGGSIIPTKYGSINPNL